MMRRLRNVFAILLAVGLGAGAVFIALRLDRRDQQPEAGTMVSAGGTQRTARPESGSKAKPDTKTRAPGQATESARAFSEFQSWTTRYLNAFDPQTRHALLAEGVAAAAARREALYELIARDPETALRRAVPWGVRHSLPTDVARWLERRVDGVGSLAVMGALPAGDTAEFQAIRREVTVGGEAYKAYVYGSRTGLSSRPAIGIHGIAIGDRMAVTESPVRVLEPGEPIPENRKIEELCAISGLPAAPDVAPPGQPVIAADTGERIVYLCSAGHIAALEDELQQQEAGGFDGDANLAASAPTSSLAIGQPRVLFIRVRFSDQGASYEPQSESSLASLVSAANAFFAANSSGQFSIAETVTPVYTLPHSAAWYSQNDTSGYARNVLEDARAVAASPDSYPGNEGLPVFDYLDYDLEAVRYSGGPGSFSGQAYVDRRGLWLKTDSSGVLCHELGHNLGLWHANAWVPSDAQTIVGPGENNEYGDVFDTMGRNSGAHWHFNTYSKAKLGWLESGAVTAVDTEDGVYRIFAHDLESAFPGGVTAELEVKRDDDRDLLIEFRQNPAWSAFASVMSGVELRWNPWQSSNGGTQLLDTTAFSREGFSDASLVIGRTFADSVAGIFITPVAKGGTTPESIDVEVRFGPFAGNHPPSVSLNASATTTGAGESVSFTVTASDPDGDALSFDWDLGDGALGSDNPTVTHTWASDGVRRVRVVVSDRKGQTASASLLVRVGESDGSIVSGTVLDESGEPVPGVRVENGVSRYSPSYREAYTDSDGGFALTEVPAGSWSISASAPGWQFARRLFVNPVEVAQDVERIDFVATHVGFEIRGTVLDADGSPVRDAIVSDGLRSEPTDEDGSFRFCGEAVGAYQITAEKHGRRFSAETIEVNYADVSGVSVVEETYTLSGEISGVDPSAAITITDGVRSTTAVAQTTSSGTRLVFSLTGVPGGARSLVAIAGDASFALAGFTSPLMVTGDRSDLVFERDEARKYYIFGRVTAESGGVAGVAVQAGSANSTTDEDGQYFLLGLESGTHSVLPASGEASFEPGSATVNLTNASVGGIDFEATLSNAAPYFTQQAAAVGETDRAFISLSAQAGDDGGAEHLRYVWSAPDADVIFLNNGTQSAKNTIAVVPAAGSYHFRVSAEDAFGASATSDVQVAVQPVAVKIDIAELLQPPWLGATTRFDVVCTDQFGNVCEPAEPVAWSVDGGGTVDAEGDFTATTAGTHFGVTASMAGLQARGSFDVGYPPGEGLGITQEVWSGIPGTQVADLTSAPSFPSEPSHVGTLRDFLEIAVGLEHNYGERLRGYFVPPTTGDYVFFVASDNSSELWLSSDSDPGKRQLIASVPTASGPRAWDTFASQRSAAIHLTEAEPVYLEVLHKENSANDHLAVGVQLPGGVLERPIPAHRLLPWGEAAFDPPQIVVPAMASPSVVGAGLTSTLNVSASSPGGSDSLTYRWEVVGSPPGPVVFLPNGTYSASSTTARFSRSGDHALRVVVTDSAGQTTSSSVDVSVVETQVSWRNQYFTPSELDNPDLESVRWGANADPDSDGVPNLLEYAYGLDPTVPSSEGIPQTSLLSVDGVVYLSISFQRNPDATDLVFTPEASSDLENWETDLVPVGEPVGGRVTYRDRQPAENFEKRFMRVRVTGP